MAAEAAVRRRGPLRYAGRALAAFVAAAFIALLAFGLATKSSDTTIDDSLARSEAVPAPGFDLPVLLGGDLGPRLNASISPRLADGRLDLEELRGTPVVLNFWASWCLPCREEAPALEAGWRGQRGAGVLFLGLNMQDLSDDARAFARQFGTTYLTVRDRTNAVARTYGVTGLPETFFLSAQGRVVGHVIGVVSAAQLRQGIAAARAGRAVGVLDGGASRPTR